MRFLFVAAVALTLTACGAPPTSPDGSGSEGGTLTSAILPRAASACTAWAGQQHGTGLAGATSSLGSQRDALYAAGGGIKAVGSKYYAAYFPEGYARAARRRILVALHGTGGSPEAEWNDWRASVDSRGWGFVGLKYLDDGSGAYDDETTIYANIKAMIDDVRGSCDLGSASLYLVGFSRGSAEAFPVAYLDVHDRRFFSAIGNNSGAWDLGGAPTPTLQAVEARQDRTAMAGTRFWMYCGAQDFTRGWSMCDEMQQARTWVETYGGTVAALYRDPSGTHGGLVRNPDAIAQMFAYFEGLP